MCLAKPKNNNLSIFEPWVEINQMMIMMLTMRMHRWDLVKRARLRRAALARQDTLQLLTLDCTATTAWPSF